MNRPTIYDSAQVQESCSILAKAVRKHRATEHQYHLAINAAQLKLLCKAVEMARLDAHDALEEEPHFAHEIQPYIDGFTHLCAQLKLLKASRKGTPNENWRGSVL